MTNFLLIGICIISGLLLRSFTNLPRDAYKGINAWLLYIALPAVSLKFIPNIQWNYSMIFPAIAPVIVWIGANIAISIYNLISPIEKPVKGALTLTSGLSNTSFLGFPLVIAYFGEKEIGTAVICDQMTFILLATVGVLTVVKASGNSTMKTGDIIRKIIKFPPFIGCITAFIIPHFIDLSPITPLLEKLAGTVGPLALFSIGLQLNFSEWKSELKSLSVGLIYKLLLAPALIAGIALMLGLKGHIVQISVFEAAMPSLVSSVVIADEYGLDPKLPNLMVGFGIILAFITTGLWWYILQVFN